jgi:hypothetical protein
LSVLFYAKIQESEFKPYRHADPISDIISGSSASEGLKGFMISLDKFDRAFTDRSLKLWHSTDRQSQFDLVPHSFVQQIPGATDVSCLTVHTFLTFRTAEW